MLARCLFLETDQARAVLRRDIVDGGDDLGLIPLEVVIDPVRMVLTLDLSVCS